MREQAFIWRRLERSCTKMTTLEAAGAAAPAPRRFVLPQFLSSQECEELEFIHRSCGVFGYRPFVLSTTLSHLVATNCAHLIIPILAVRERVKEAVEQYFGREYELFVEFTGLISWTRGANIGWHSDDNRSYLRQRHYSAVCYLNTYEQDFKGGLFHFQDGEPLTIIPSLGTLVIYTADERNTHRVDEVTEGERCTLALWFTSDQAHDEDQKLIQQIFTAVPDLDPLDNELEEVLGLSPPKQKIRCPIAASSAMYKAHNLQEDPHHQPTERTSNGESANPYFVTTNDLRSVRLELMGLRCRFSTTTGVDDQHDHPVVLTYKDRDVPHLFSCGLEALQVAQFHQFQKAMSRNGFSGFGGQSTAEHCQTKTDNCTTSTRGTLSGEASVGLEFLEDPNRVSVSSLNADREEWDSFLDSVQKFETYTCTLWRKLYQCFPSWRTNGSLLLIDP